MCINGNQLLTCVISPYICTLKFHIFTRYLARRVINIYKGHYTGSRSVLLDIFTSDVFKKIYKTKQY